MCVASKLQHLLPAIVHYDVNTSLEASTLYHTPSNLGVQQVLESGLKAVLGLSSLPLHAIHIAQLSLPHGLGLHNPLLKNLFRIMATM